MNDPRMKGMKKRQREIAEEFRRRGTAMPRGVAKALGIDPNGMSQSAQVLVRRGLIRVVGTRPPSSSTWIDDVYQWVPAPAEETRSDQLGLEFREEA